MTFPKPSSASRLRDGVHVLRGVVGGGLVLLVAFAVLGYDRVDLCNAHFEGCGDGGHPTRAVMLEIALVLLAVGAFWGARRVRRLLGESVARDAGPWLRRAYLAALWLGVLAVLGVVAVAYVASVERQLLPGLPDPDVTVSRWVVAIAWAIAAYLPARFYADAQEARDLGRATSQSPSSAGLRRFTGTVVGTPGAPGVTVPESGQHVAAWAVEALVSHRMERETSRPASGSADRVGPQFETVVTTRYWELLWASPSPVALSTDAGIVMVDTAGVDVEGDELWQGSTLVHAGLYPDHAKDMKRRQTYDYRVTAVPFGAAVQASGRIERRDGVPWLVAARMPSRPEGIPPTYVRRDGLRNVLQTVRRGGQPRTF